MNKDLYSRQILMFGEKGQRLLEKQRIGIVGAGGIGLQICQALAYLGAKQFTLIDDDRMDQSNLNRAVGATQKDIGRLKVEVAQDLIQDINPKAEVERLAKNLRTQESMKRAIECTSIFGCVDRDAPRLVLSELTQAYNIPLIDVASEIIPDDTENMFGGRVVVARPGDYCLFCADQIDTEVAKAELESPQVKAARERHGYGLGEIVAAPSVIALNGIMANLAAMEFIVMVTGIREPARRITYKGMRPIVTNSTDSGKSNCLCCSMKGLREDANIWRYVASN